MHVISFKKLKQFWQSHPDAEVSLRYWYKLTTVHKWQSFNDIVQTFPRADKVKNFVVFDIGGNNFRLITYVDYVHGKVFIRDVLTHAEYDKRCDPASAKDARERAPRRKSGKKMTGISN